ncbi:FHA domain-containing protein [Neorhodopirellula lusitana]|uniref:FHA domain-containing protein n=1 Tax=Neorhodopirellula lusitana TaxID=445327 RepID=UPI00384B5077
MKTTARPTPSDDVLNASAATASAANLASMLDASRWDEQRAEPEDTDRGSKDSRETAKWASTPSSWQKDTSLEFRVRCEGQPTRRLRLSGARYTLGSGTGCSIRLDDESLRPLHAVLIRDHQRVLVRAYSVPLYINDDRVSEGVLEINDRLRLGGYEFELLSNSPLPISEQRTSSERPATKPVAVSTPEITHGDLELAAAYQAGVSEVSQPVAEPVQPAPPATTESDAWQRAFHEDAKQWRSLKQDVQKRTEWCSSRERELHEQRQWLDRQMAILQQRHDELGGQEAAAMEVQEEFNRRYEDLIKRQDELALQEQELDAGREHLRLQQERLDGRDRLHRRQIEQLLEEQERFREQEVVHQKVIADSKEQLRMSHQRADAATSAVEQMRSKFALLNDQLLQLTQQQEELQRLEAERNREHQAQCDHLALARDEALSQRDEVARQRDEALDGKAHSDARRERAIIQRDELECIEEQLRVEIQHLQDEIAQTRQEAVALDADCQTARDTIAKLEETIQINEERHELDRQSWTEEVESLRRNVDELTIDLAGAQTTLSKLRDENDRLALQLNGVTEERDDAVKQRDAALSECEVANKACDAARAEIEGAHRTLQDALSNCEQALRERDEIAGLRDDLSSELKTTHEQLDDWKRRNELAERRYDDAQRLVDEARDQWQVAEHARDEAEAKREAAEVNLAAAQRDVAAMQTERDEAVSEYDNLKRQRDEAVHDASETRRLYDRSNRDHDDTLDKIELLEQQTRDLIDHKKKANAEPGEHVGPALALGAALASPALGLIRDDQELDANESGSAELQAASEFQESSGFQIAGEPEPETESETSLQDSESEPSLLHIAATDESDVDESLVADSSEDPVAVVTASEPAESIEPAAVVEADEDVWPTYSTPAAMDEAAAEELPVALDVHDATTPEDITPSLGIAQGLDEVESSDAAPLWNSVAADPDANLNQSDVSVAPIESTSDADVLAMTGSVEPVADEYAPDVPEWPEESSSYLLPEERVGGEAESAHSAPTSPVAPESEVEPAVQQDVAQDSSTDEPAFGGLFEPESAASLEAANNVYDSEVSVNENSAGDELTSEDSIVEESVSEDLVRLGLVSESRDETHADEPPYTDGSVADEPQPVESSFLDSSYHDSLSEGAFSSTGESEEGLSSGEAVGFTDEATGYSSEASGFSSEENMTPAEESLSERLLREMGLEVKSDASKEQPSESLGEPAGQDATAWQATAPTEEDAWDQDASAGIDTEAGDELAANVTAQWQPSDAPQLADVLRSDAMQNDNVAQGNAFSGVGQQEEEDGADLSYGDMISESSLPAEDDSDYSTTNTVDAYSPSEKEEVFASETASQLIEPIVCEPEEVAPVIDEVPLAAVPEQSGAGADESVDDDSIEAYMNRLLQRVQGQPDEAPVPAAKAEPVAKSEPVVEANTEASDLDASDSMEIGTTSEAEVSPDAPLVPRSQAPERNSNLSAMRELANESARSAITRSNRSQSHTTRIQAMLKFAYAGIALICGLIAVAMIDLMMLKVIAVIAALVAAGIFIKEGFGLMAELGQRKPAAASAVVVEAETEE